MFVTFSTQLAHLMYLGAEAQGPGVRRWDSEFLKSTVIAWAQHVDLIWVTLDHQDQSKVLAQAQNIYKTKTSTMLKSNTAENNNNSESYLCAILENNLSNGTCQNAILLRVICNTETQDAVRVAAIHHIAEMVRNTETLAGKTTGTTTSANSTSICHKVGQQITQHLKPQRHVNLISKISATISQALEQPLSENTHHLDAKSKADAIKYLSAPDTLEAVGFGLSLQQMCLTANLGAIDRIVHQLMSNKGIKASTIYNVCLFAAINVRPGWCDRAQSNYLFLNNVNTSNNRHLELLQRAIIKEFTIQVLHIPNVDTKLQNIVPLHAYPLAYIARLDQAFGQEYVTQLASLIGQCQLAMLSVYTDHATNHGDTFAGSDETISSLVEKCQQLYNQEACRGLVTLTLNNDRTRFEDLKNTFETVSENPVFRAVVAFWDAFYQQFTM